MSIWDIIRQEDSTNAVINLIIGMTWYGWKNVLVLILRTRPESEVLKRSEALADNLMMRFRRGENSDGL